MGDSTDWSALRQALTERRSALRARLEEGNSDARPVSLEDPIGRLTRMDAMQRQEMAQAQIRLTHQEVARIEAALRRIDEGTFGTCVECGEAIAAGRLRIKPEVLLCIECQALKER